MKQISLKRFLLFTILSTALFSFKPFFADKANFSGTWKLNEGKSELGEFGGRMAARTITVEDKGSSLMISRVSPGFDGGENTTTETLSMDGKESESTVFGQAKKKSTAQWSDDGQTLTINSTIAFDRDGQTMEIKGKEVWKLDNGMLTLQNSSTTPMGEMSTKAVYEK